MARGFDSKSVEEQQSAFVAKSDQTRGAPLTREEAARQRLREGLLLSRKQVLAQLATATASRHREMLEQALADLDAQIQKLS